MSKSDSTVVLRRLPIVVGALAGTLLFANRLLTPASELTSWQSRSDAVGVIISALLVLTGLLWQRVQPVPPEAVILEGEEGFELAEDLPEVVKTELAWASHLLLTNTVTKSLVVWYDDRVLLRRGVLSPNPQVKPGAIVERVLDKQKPVYLVKLDLYPGKVEFDYLPFNTQGLICQPLNRKGVLVLGANAPRSYTQQDERWIEGIAEKLAASLERELSSA
ncbi:cofactor assembly of complex C subunit B [Baaleninema sp.]|uniref:cofactor assembly of complex C subunit B n=1 Tax=Baaleninema sp. TaxID=3101197 RepID=UPI003CFD9D2D